MPAATPRTPEARVAEALPDLPRWVEVRAILLSGRGTAAAFSPGPTPSCVVVQKDTGLGVVIGEPTDDALRESTAACREVLAYAENLERVRRVLGASWSCERATLHVLGDAPRLPPLEPGAVRLLAPPEIDWLGDLPEELREELEVEVRAGTPIAAALCEGRPVSFCHGGMHTERWWDVAIDTLPSHQRRGFASLAAAFEIARQRRLGRAPVWGAADSNEASRAMALRLGFVPCDELFVLERRFDP